MQHTGGAARRFHDNGDNTVVWTLHSIVADVALEGPRRFLRQVGLQKLFTARDVLLDALTIR